MDEQEAAIIRQLFQLYVANNGAKTVARALNQRGRWYRKGKPWSKDLVLKVLEEPAVAGTYWWGKYDVKTRRKKDRSEWLPLKVEPIVEPQLYDLARQLRSERDPGRNPGRAPSPETLLRGLVRCAQCGSSYTLESSGKRAKGEVYKYRYYNCRKTCRIGKEACSGRRIPTAKLDAAVLDFIAQAVCTEDRCVELIDQFRLSVGHLGSPLTTGDEPVARVQEAWSAMIRGGGTIGGNYLHHLIERIEVDENRITVVPKVAFSAMP